MPIPAHMWLKDDGGADIKGSSTVQDREGSIEIISFGHGVNLPVDSADGKITGKRTHSPIAFEKEFAPDGRRWRFARLHHSAEPYGFPENPNSTFDHQENRGRQFRAQCIRNN